MIRTEYIDESTNDSRMKITHNTKYVCLEMNMDDDYCCISLNSDDCEKLIEEMQSYLEIIREYKDKKSV